MSPTGDLSRELDAAGKDPLRYLNRSLLDDEGARRRARARIRGLRDLAEVNAWLSVEKKLQRGPRSTVVDWLEERRDEVLELGIHDLDDWLEDAPHQDTELASVCRIIRETDDGYEAVDPDSRGPRVTTQRPALDAFLERRDADDQDDVEDDREPTPDVDTVGLQEQTAVADGGEDLLEDVDLEENEDQEVVSDGGATVANCPDCGTETTDHRVLDMTRAWCPDCSEFQGETR